MCMHLMQGDIQGAMHSNYMLFTLMPMIIFIMGDYILRYVRTGEKKLRQWENIVTYVMIALLVGFGAVRNVIGI